jgi:F-type H+-transporting ATPase subunit b
MRRSRLVLSLALLALLAFASLAQGGEDPHRATDGASEASSSSQLSNEPARESREAAGEDETAEFKQSAAVKWVARTTGLSVESAYWLCVLLNFAVVFGFIYWAAKKSLPGLFRDRTVSIQKAMEEARVASEDAKRRLSEIENRLARLDTEIGTMRSAAEAEGRAEEDRIRTGTEEELRKVVESAEQEISAAAKVARRELRAFAADLIVSMAEKQVKVDPGTDQALVRGFAEGLSNDGVPRSRQ